MFEHSSHALLSLLLPILPHLFAPRYACLDLIDAWQGLLSWHVIERCANWCGAQARRARHGEGVGTDFGCESGMVRDMMEIMYRLIGLDWSGAYGKAFIYL